MLPRLQAEEAIQTANRVAVGSGVLKPGAARDVAAGWERAAHRGRARSSTAAASSPDALAAIGIGYTVVPPSEATS